jgi:hypothetical protein
MVATQDAVSHLCYAKASWSDAWVEMPDLVCLRFSDQAGPAHGSAEFRWVYGEQLRPAIGSRPADSTYEVVDRSGLLGKYVKVLTSNGLGWMGIVVDVTDTRRGAGQEDTESPVISQGVEVLAAFALTYLWDLNPIRESVVDENRIGEVFAFNGGANVGRGPRSENNCSLTLASPEFTADADVVAWTAKKVLQYVLNHFSPLDADGSALIAWQFEQLEDAGFSDLDYEIPQMDPAGMTPWQLMNKVIDRRRGLGLRHRLVFDDEQGDDGEEVLHLSVFSTLAEPVALEDAEETILRGNSDVVQLDISAAVNVLSLQLTKSAVQQADRVRVIGERRGSVRTLDAGDELVPDWEESKVTEYNTARSANSNYDDLTEDEKSRANARFRAADEFRKVFAQWRLDAYTLDTFPQLDADGEVLEVGDHPQWLGALRFEKSLPMLADVDYSGEIEPAADADPQEFIPPLVWFNHELAERMDADADTTEDGRKWSVQVRVVETAPALRLEVVGGQQHFIASDLYAENGTYEAIEAADHAVASDSWRATVYMLQQDRVEASEPAEPVSGDVERVVEIQVPGAYLDYLVPGTTVGVTHGTDGSTEYQTATGGWLRDDRERLQNIAKLAWSYYSVPQQSLRFAFRAVSAVATVGQMITDLVELGQSEEINSVVTGMDIDLESQVTTLQTAFSELDFVELV